MVVMVYVNDSNYLTTYLVNGHFSGVDYSSTKYVD